MLFEGGIIKHGLSFPILMDTGATANFISPQLLKKLQLECQLTDAMLRLADNTEAPILGKVQLKLKIQQFSCVVWCFVTDLCKEFDVILGNNFMIGHNAILNFQRLTVSLTRHGKRFTLKAGLKTGNAADTKLFLNCAQARRSLKNGCEAFLIMVNALLDTDTDASSDVTCAENVTNTDTENSLADGIASLRLQFADIFEPPKGLPPDRGIEHVIPTLAGAQPPFMRMYRLSPAELAEVKAQVQDLLERGLIEPSTSAYGATYPLCPEEDWRAADGGGLQSTQQTHI